MEPYGGAGRVLQLRRHPAAGRPGPGVRGERESWGRTSCPTARAGPRRPLSMAHSGLGTPVDAQRRLPLSVSL